MKRVLVGLVALAVVFALGAGGFVIVAMGALSSSALAAGGSSGCVPSSTTSTAGPAPSSAPTGAPPAPRPTASAASSTTTAAAPTDSLEIPKGSNRVVTLNAKQVAIATSIITVGRQLEVSDKGVKVALMTALQESVLRMYANSSIPESLNYNHDVGRALRYRRRPPSAGRCAAP